jgi:error-prone DNA polymerase
MGRITHHHRNQPVRVAGCASARQRSGTAQGFIFLSLEDKSGLPSVILASDAFVRYRIIGARTLLH